MPDLPTLKSLLERVEAATKPDRELDGEIAKVFGKPHGPYEFVSGRSYVCTPEQSPAFTSSLDASLSLVNEMLPGWWWSIEATGGQTGTGKTIYHARVHGVHEGQRAFGMTASTPTLALLAALLRALIQKETADHA